MRRTHAQHCRCGTRLAADHAGLLCAACQRKSSADFTAAPSVPPDFWLTPKMRAAFATRHLGMIIYAYRTHPYHGRVLPQTTIAAWGSVGQANISRLETGPQVHDMQRLAFWVRALRIPPRLLWFELPPPVAGSPPGGDDERTAEPEEVSPTRRRDAIAFTGLALAAPALEGLERELDILHLTLDRGTTSDERTAHLERVATELGVRVVDGDAREHAAPALRTLRTVRALLEERQPTHQQVQLVRVSAMLSTIMGEILYETGNFAKAREWYVTAEHAANDAGDQYLADAALAGQAYLPTYSGDPRGVLALVQPRLEQKLSPTPIAAWLWGFSARAHASLGDKAAFQRSMQNAYQLMDDSPAELIGPGIFSRQPANLLFYEATSAVALRQPDIALTAADHALAQPLAPGDADLVLIPLERASALAQSGEVPEACRVAREALLQPGWHDVSVRTYAAKFDEAIRGIQSPETREWREVLAGIGA
jgi:tetratricopeptide (TPR) repeat protein